MRPKGKKIRRAIMARRSTMFCFQSEFTWSEKRGVPLVAVIPVPSAVLYTIFQTFFANL